MSVVGGLVLLGWTGLMVYAVYDNSRNAAIADVETTPIGELTAGVHRVRGTGVIEDEIFDDWDDPSMGRTAPFTGRPVLAVEHDVSVYRDYQWEPATASNKAGAQSRGAGSWENVFVVEDATGRALVATNALNADIGDRNTDTIEVGGDQEPPPRVQAFIDSDDNILGSAHRPRRYLERRIEPGYRLTVHGRTTPLAECDFAADRRALLASHDVTHVFHGGVDPGEPDPFSGLGRFLDYLRQQIRVIVGPRYLVTNMDEREYVENVDSMSRWAVALGVVTFVLALWQFGLLDWLLTRLG